MNARAHLATLLKRVLHRTGWASYVRVADRRTLRALGMVTACSVITSFLEVAALTATLPLIELLSGGDLGDAGVPGRVAERFIGGSTRQSQTLVVIGVVVGLLLAKVASSAIVRWWTIGLTANGATVATTNLVACYLAAPLQYHSRRNSAVASRTVALSISTVFSKGLLGVSTVLTEACVIVLVGLLLVVVSPVAALAAVVYFGVALALFRRFTRHRADELARERDETAGRGLLQLQQAIGGLREIRIGGDESEEIEAFRETRSEQRELERRMLFGGGHGRYYLEAVFLLGFGVVATVQLLTQESDGVAGLAVMLAAGFRLLPSAGRMMHAVNDAREGEGCVSIVTDELDQMGFERLDPPPSTFGAAPSTDAGPKQPANIELRDVEFTYEESDRPAVAELNLTVARGESLGIVGASGSGKSTTVDLICGLLEPTAGQILFDGRPLSSHRPRIGYVSQNVFLLDGTVKQNVTFSDDTIDEAALARAVRLARLDQWIASLPDGLDTRVGERGGLVSGGQLQRIGIARALYLDPALLILDEATSALDVETEASVMEAIRNLHGVVTVIVVAHRLSTVRRCDRLMVLSDGRCVGLASFDELSRDHALFARWVTLANIKSDVSA